MRSAVLLNSLFVLLPTLAAAQTVTVSPQMPSVAVSKSVTFTAQVTGLSNSAVTWSAGGAVGGNSTAGTITTAGVYKAPSSLPAQNPVQIVATSVADPSYKAITYVNILSLGPAVTRVAPNPLPLGTYTVTIQGAGFQPGATVNNSGIQLSTNSVTPTRITATGYQGHAATAVFCVKNPGSICSKTITVPVGSGATAYPLTVVNGVGGGSYAAGAVVTISANAPASGQIFKSWTGATVTNANSASTTLTMPAANTTVTANYAAAATTYTLTVVNGTGGGSYAAGATVNIAANAAPSGQVFKNWTGATVANPAAPATSLTMPAANTTVTANYASNVVTQIPFPVTTHPRLWVTPGDLARLRNWATSSNPVYQQGLAQIVQQAVSLYRTQFFPNGVANPNYPDPGDTQGYTGYLTEQYGEILAFQSLIDPSPANRAVFAQYARNMLMYAMNEAAKGHLAGAPFRDPAFAVYNRASGSGEGWPLMVDWLYNAVDGNGNPILTASDKLTIRNVFLQWAVDCLNASTTGGDHPEPIGVTNSAQLLPNNLPYRMAANNYYTAHARLLTMMSLVLDPADDPPLNSSLSAAVQGNSMRSYILNATGAWLYQQYAMYGEPTAIASAYGIPGNGTGFGLASGGLPPEGMLYGVSYANLLEGLLALQTSGFNNPAYSGPQIALIGTPMWDRYVKGVITSITPSSRSYPGPEAYLGNIYQFAS